MGGAFSEETPSNGFPSTGKVMMVRVQCSHTGRRVDITECNGSRVTSDWTSSDLRRAIEQKTGVHRKCQTLMFGGLRMDPDSTIREILGARPEQLPVRLTIFMVVNQEAFPQRLGPFALVHVPFQEADFIVPQITEDLRMGFYWEMKTGILESHGLRARCARITGQVSPLHPVHNEEAWRRAACIPPEAQDFAWSYPVADWERVESDAYALEDWESPEASARMKSFLTVGGFMYFDSAGRVVGTATPGRQMQGMTAGLQFASPDRWRPEWTQMLAEHGRFQPVTMREVVSLGARMFCWLRPNEIIEDTDGQPLPVQPRVPHGGFVYLFHEDVINGNHENEALDRYFPMDPDGQAAMGPDGRHQPVKIDAPGGLGLFRAISLIEDGPDAHPEWAGGSHPLPCPEEAGCGDEAVSDDDEGGHHVPHEGEVGQVRMGSGPRVGSC